MILRNSVRCKKCLDVIESTSRHDFKFCKCGEVFVDGGHDYLRRGGTEKENFEDLSVCVDKDSLEKFSISTEDGVTVFTYLGKDYTFDKTTTDILLEQYLYMSDFKGEED